jgi:hypothetical protein
LRPASRRASRARLRPRVFGFLLGGLALGGLCPLGLVLAMPGHWVPEWGVAVPLVGVVVLAAWQLAHLATTTWPEFLAITFWCFVYVTAGVAPIVQLSFGYFPWPGEYSSDEIAAGFGMILAASLAFYAGSRLLPLVRLPRTSQPISMLRTRVGTVAALATSASFVAGLGGVDQLFMSRTAYLDLITTRYGMSGYAVITTTARAIPLVTALALSYRVRQRIRSGQAWQASGILWATTALLAVVVGNPVISPRFWSGTVIGSLTIAWPFFRTEPRPWIWVTGSVLAFTLAFPVADSFRTVAPREVLSGEQTLGDIALPSLDAFGSGDFDVFQQSMNALRLVKQNGVDMGRQFSGSLLFWVPRDLWSDKPVHSGEFAASQLGYAFTNVGFPLWSEAFLAFGWIGVIALFALYGMLTTSLDRAYGSQEGGRVTATIVGPLVAVLAPYQFFLLRGALLPAVAFITPTILFILFLPGRLPRHRSLLVGDRSSRALD